VSPDFEKNVDMIFVLSKIQQRPWHESLQKDAATYLWSSQMGDLKKDTGYLRLRLITHEATGSGFQKDRLKGQAIIPETRESSSINNQRESGDSFVLPSESPHPSDSFLGGLAHFHRQSRVLTSHSTW